MSKSRHFRYLFVLLTAIAMNLVACDDDSSATTPSAQEEPSSSVKENGSSGSVKSSSSVSSNSAESSSSRSKISSSADCGEVEKGTMVDGRDGQEYKTVKICGQVWMAENLNFDYNYGTASSFCYKGLEENCDKYGRLYLWSAVMDSAGVFSTDGIGCGVDADECLPSIFVRGVCPEGWHVPSKTEFETLLEAIGSKLSDSSWDWENAGKLLKSTTDDWEDEGMGEDAFGFAVLPAGNRSRGRNPFGNFGIFASFATSTNDMWADNHSYSLNLYCSRDNAEIISSYTYEARSVRCLKN